MVTVTTRSYEASGDLSGLIERAATLPSGDLALALKDWRGRMQMVEAARLLGLPLGTYAKIEQGRGFRYPALLLQAMRDLKPHGRWR